MVFYRKYRPQTIEELDSKVLRDALNIVLSSKNVPHAFLFTGPKGLGKTSTARIVAKAVNCLQGQTINKELRTKKSDLHEETILGSKFKVKSSEGIEPCNKCYQCKSITNGTNVDVLEIDGASNRGIDEIRDLREKIRLAPAAASKKVYIIDEVHMLTQEAFNALLKTLEEPPSHVIFVLCTTEPHKVPATIISRCSHISFKKATTEELVRSFRRIAQLEKLSVDDEALQFIASLSDGSFRDGAKILEEMAGYGKKITKESVQEKYQIRQMPDQILEMIGYLSKRDAKEGLQLVGRMLEQGVDMKYYLEQLVSELHQRLLVEIGAIENLELRTKNLELRMEEIKELVELLARAYGELKYAVLPQLPLELVIVEWSEIKKVALRSPSKLDESSDASAPAVRLAPDLGVRSPSATLMKTSSHRKAPRATETDNFWQELISRVKTHNHSIAGVLRGCTLKSYDNKEIVIETGYKFHKERLDEKKTREILEKASEEIAGKTVSISVLLK